MQQIVRCRISKLATENEELMKIINRCGATFRS
jgi:hypothetical protein